MKRALEQYYKQSIQDVGALNIGNSSGRKLVFSINGKRLFAKEVYFSLPLLRKYQLLKSKAAHIPEAVIPQDIIPFSQTTMIVVSDFIAGDTLDIVYLLWCRCSPLQPFLPASISRTCSMIPPTTWALSAWWKTAPRQSSSGVTLTVESSPLSSRRT